MKAKQENQMTERLLLSRKDCASLLGCGLSKIDEWISSGELPSFKWGGHRKVHTKDLQDFASEMRDAGVKRCDLGVEPGQN